MQGHNYWLTLERTLERGVRPCGEGRVAKRVRETPPAFTNDAPVGISCYLAQEILLLWLITVVLRGSHG